MSDASRSQALDHWDYQVPFGRFHIRWDDGDLTPAFEQQQAYAIVIQDLFLDKGLEIFGHREVLVTFSSEYVQVGSGPAERVPAWVVMVAGQKRSAVGPLTGGLVTSASPDYLSAIAPGGGAVVQALVHARTGEVLLGTAVPVRLERR